MQRAEPGWYPDPERSGQVRYYDGEAWTSHVRDVAPSDTSPGGPPPGDAPLAGDAGAASADPPGNRAMVLLFAAVLMVVVLVGTLFLGTLAGDGDEGTDVVATEPDAEADAEPDAAAPQDDAPDDGSATDDAGDADDTLPDDADDPDADGPDGEPDDAAGPQSPTSDGGYDAPFEMTIDPATSYLATIETSEGDIVLELDPVDAPIATNNLVNLARDGYYDGVVFHRVIEGFVIQGGDPTATGAGGPGYRFEDELGAAEELVAEHGGYPRGTLAMANAGPDTNGSQFFIVHGDLIDLPPAYTVFGRVTAGTEVVDTIAGSPTDGSDRPVTDVTITTIDIAED